MAALLERVAREQDTTVSALLRRAAWQMLTPNVTTPGLDARRVEPATRVEIESERAAV